MSNKAMGSVLAQDKYAHNTADIKFHEGPIMLPEDMSPRKAYKALGDFIRQQEEETEFNVSFECLPQDGAAALNSVLISLYGWSTGIPTPGFFGPNPPTMIEIKTGVNTSIQVPWGRLALPNLDGGYVTTELTRADGIIKFQLVANCKRKDENFIKMLFDKVGTELRDNSILRGKCFTIVFTDDEGNVMNFPAINFVDLSKYDMDRLILPENIRRSLEISVWAPMRHHDVVIKEEGNLKRSILAAGGYGTGKTLSMSNTAKLGEDQGFTVVYCKKTKEFGMALRVARNYQDPCSVLIVEDIDVELAAGRSDDLNQIINTLDGLETKNDNIITLMTTNNIESLEPAAIRQGRVSAKVLFRNPDAKAAEQLLRVNAGKLLDKKEDLTEVSKYMDGMNPAEIEEIVTIAKLAHLSINGQAAHKLTAEDVLEAAKYMQTQAEIQRKIEDIHNVEEELTINDMIGDIISQRDKDYEPKLRRIVNEESDHDH